MDLRGFLERYGLSLVVLVALASLVAFLPGNAAQTGVTTGAGPGGTGVTVAGGGTGTQAGGSAALGGAGGAGGGGSATGGSGGGTPAGGVPASGVGFTFGEGPNCRADGRQGAISRYSPPCVRWDGGDNGGGTEQGVSADQVVVVRYLPQIDPGSQAILESADLSDDPATIRRAYEVLFRYFNAHSETYGRNVVFQDFVASGPSESAENMKADALQIAEEIRPFAVIEGNPAAPMPTVLVRELLTRGVLCICSTTLPTAFYNEFPGMIFSSLPALDDYAAMSAEYVATHLAGKPAIYAGDEFNPPGQDMQGRERVFGLIYLNGARGVVDPEGDRARLAMERQFDRFGIHFAVQIAYIYNPGRNSQEVTSVIAQLKEAGVTTVVPVWDPLYPILITTEATKQLYFPEWMIVGTGLSDTTTAGRLYDQRQWSHAFGISPLWVGWATVAQSPGYREYHHMEPNAPAGEEGVLINVYRARIATLFRGIHMAGPNLTYQSFAAGQYAYPPTGGTPSAPLVYVTPEDPVEIHDFSEVWWDATARGPDERERVGDGMMMRADGGRRYQLGQWPVQDPSRANPATVTDNPPEGADPPHEADGHTHPS